MTQTALFKPMPRKWDAIRHEPFDDEHQRALEGLPGYWRINWGFGDWIILDCGHKLFVRVEILNDNDADYLLTCPHKEFGGCDAD